VLRQLQAVRHLTPDITALAPALDAGRTRLAARKRTLAETRADVASLVERYTEFVS
jgi:hypothetical protein